MSSMNGFTLMEMMVVIAIFTIASGMAFTALRFNDVYRDSVGVQIELESNNKKALDAISEELRLSKMSVVTIKDSNKTINFKTPLFTNPDTYDIVWGADNTEGYAIQYRLDTVAKSVVREILDSGGSVVSGKTSTIANNIQDSQFATLPNYSIQITTTSAKKTTEGKNETLTSQSTVYLRND